MKAAVLIAILASSPLFAQPACVRIADSHIYGIGNLPANGTIAISIGYSTADGSYTFPQSDTILQVVNGTLLGPTGPGYCPPPGAVLQATYAIARTGVNAAGVTMSPRFWTIPMSGGPYAVKDVESGSATPPSAMFPPVLIMPCPSGQVIGTPSDGGSTSCVPAGSLGFTPENTANKDAVGGYAGLDGSGKLKPAEAPVWNQSTSGNAATASALANAPSLCPSGSYTLGINISGNAQACTALPTFPTGAIVGTSDTQTLTNKTLDGVSPTTMGYLDATSSIQTQLNGKQGALGFTPENTANKDAVSGYAGLDGSGKLKPAEAPVWNQSTSGNAATASALANAPSLCPSGSYTLGINISGNAQACTALPTFPAGVIVGTFDMQTLTNKTIDGVSPTTMGYLDATSSIQSQLNGKASSTASTAVNGQTCQLSSTCNVNSGSASHGVAINEGNGNAIAGTAAGTAHQLLASGGSSADPGYQDGRDVIQTPFNICFGGSGSGVQVSEISGWSNNCRAGTNNKTGALQATPSTGGVLLFPVELPRDWDSNVQPWVNVYFGSGTNTSGTVIFTSAEACEDISTNGGATDDPAFNSESPFPTLTMAAANRVWFSGGQFTVATSANGCKPGSLLLIKLTLSGTAAAAINGYYTVITIPTLPNPSQAN